MKPSKIFVRLCNRKKAGAFVSFLSQDKWVEVVRNAPLVSIDLIVQNENHQVLLGWRTNRPAQQTWFVPGGVVRKGETLDFAFQRILRDELAVGWQNLCLSRQALFYGLYEHHYEDNFLGASDFGTHYIVLAHKLSLQHLQSRGRGLSALPTVQHRKYAWMDIPELLVCPDVHANVKAYFRNEV
jgi:colanic acid biosynthesis protein WcaH